MKTIWWRHICNKDEHLHVATIELKRMHTPAMHRHDFYECFLILEGNGKQSTPSGDTDLQRHSLYFVRPEHEHAINGQRNLVFLNLAFERLTFEAALALAGFAPKNWQPHAPIHSEILDENQVKEFLNLVATVANQRDQSNAAWLLLSISRVLSQKQASTPILPSMPDWMVDGFSKVADRDVITEGLPLLNQLMGRSREHVARSFQNNLGMTPTEWLNKERIQRACLLLATTRLSVLEIALDCGFESTSYFHKCFRELKQTTPRQYRKDLMSIQK